MAVDADISIEFSNPVANDAAIASDTYTGGTDLGVQQSGDLTVRYALTSIAIQRSPRFGPDAGTWTDLVAPVDTELDLTGGGSLHEAPAASFRWDADCRADGVLSPRRLLINSRTPYSVTVGSSRERPGGGRRRSRLSMLRTNEAAGRAMARARLRLDGVRAAARRFGAVLGWERLVALGPGAGHDQWLRHACRAGVRVRSRWSRRVRARSTSVSRSATAYLLVDGSGTAGTYTVEAYRGLTLVDTQTIGPATSGEVTLSAPLDAGMTRVVLRAHPAAGSSTAVGLLGLQICAIAYLTCADATYVVGRAARCGTEGGGGTTVGGAGKLAFLPNTDYVVTPTVTVTISHRTAGAKTLTLTQPAYFRTKGLVGLNTVANVGDELTPYVAAAYPQGGSFPLYREEPVALAFTEDMSNLLPVDRTPAPGDPPEKTQLMQLTLTVERVGSTDGLIRLSSADTDWLTAHGGPLTKPGPPFLSSLFATLLVRRATSLDAQVLEIRERAGGDRVRR